MDKIIVGFHGIDCSDYSNEIIYQKAKQSMQDIMGKNLKPNPNHYPIIDKWNYKYVYAPNRDKVFKKLEEMIDMTLSPILEKLNDVKEDIKC